MPTSDQFPENWESWEIDPSTRTSVHVWNKYIPIDGVILTKMDGTARGGIAVPIMTELNLPIYFMGVGEQVDDLIPFDCQSYLKGLAGIKEEASA